MRIAIKTLFIALGAMTLSVPVLAGDAADASLYERLGGWDNIERIVTRTIDLHLENDKISHFFAPVDRESLEGHVVAFFAAGTGGPAKYAGRDMGTAHAGMEMTDADFDAAVADVLRACKDNGVGETEVAEVKAILESLRPAVMGMAEKAAAR